MNVRQLTAVLLMVALATAAACSSDGDNACDAAYKRVDACMRSLDCSGVPAEQRASCDFNKSTFFQFSESTWKQACENDGTGDVKKLASCPLDSNRCQCAAGSLDTGVNPQGDAGPGVDAYRDSAPPRDGSQITPVSWAQIPAGSYQMGCSPNDAICDNAEKPTHGVSITAFEMTITEITQEQFQAVMGINPSAETNCAKCPVNNITWQSAKDYCVAIGGRLPSEAEWEYAARAGTTTRFYCGDDTSCLDAIAWWSASGNPRSAQPVGQKAQNGFGLYDMLGNVWEWNEDCWHADYTGHPATNPAWLADNDGKCDRRMLRGGSASSIEWEIRASSRGREYADTGDRAIGFRCAR